MYNLSFTLSIELELLNSSLNAVRKNFINFESDKRNFYIAVNNFSENCQVIGAEPSNVDDAYRSLMSGKIEFNESTNTIADGLRTNLGSINFPIIQNYVKEILLVSEDEIMDSLDIIINKLKIVVEPSSAVVLAALIKNNKKFKNKNIGLIMCGGNIDFNSLKF